MTQGGSQDQGPANFRFGTFDSGRTRFVSGVFEKVDDAERVVVALQERGFSNDQITVVMSEEMRQKYLSGDRPTLEIEKKSRAAEGAGKGGAIGVTLGAIAGAVAAAGTSLAIPGLGLVVAGPLVAALAGAGAVGTTGGLLGALVGAGMPEYRARYYDERVKGGAIVVGVEARSEDEAKAIEGKLEDFGAEDVKQT